MKTILCASILLLGVLVACDSASQGDASARNFSDKAENAPERSDAEDGKDQLGPHRNQFEATMHYLDSANLLKEYYYPTEPQSAPFSNFQPILSTSPDTSRFLGSMKHYDGFVSLYQLHGSAPDNRFMVHLEGPVPGPQFLLLFGRKTQDDAYQLLAREEKYSRMSIDGRPVIEIRPVLPGERENLLFRWSDIVVSRYSETVTVYSLSEDQFQSRFELREYTEEGPAYRDINPKDTGWVHISMRMNLPESGPVDEILRVSGEVLRAPELKAPLSFRETYKWNLQTRSFEMENGFSYRIDEEGRFRLIER